jgi:thiosulfate dehydrogenase [quinone] large subunit
MATTTSNRLVGETATFNLTGGWQTTWVAMLRLITGWWFFHAGITKVIESGLNYGFAPMYLQGMGETVLGPVALVLGNQLSWFVVAAVPLFETLIGLALLAGVLTRLASVGGVFFMSLFWVGNAGFAHGVVNGDLMGMLLFMTMIVFAAGRYYGLDAILVESSFVQNHPRLRYLL